MTTSDVPTSAFVVGYDGSGSSGKAMEYVCRLATHTGAQVHAVYVVHPEALIGLSPLAEGEWLQGVAETVEEFAVAATQQLADAGVAGSFHRRDGDPVSELAAAAQELDAHAIAVGRSSGRIAHVLLGGVPLRLARHVNIPLLIIP